MMVIITEQSAQQKPPSSLPVNQNAINLNSGSILVIKKICVDPFGLYSGQS